MVITFAVPETSGDGPPGEFPDEHGFITTVESCWKSMEKSMLFILLSIIQIPLSYNCIVSDPNKS